MYIIKRILIMKIIRHIISDMLVSGYCLCRTDNVHYQAATSKLRKHNKNVDEIQWSYYIT